MELAAKRFSDAGHYVPAVTHKVWEMNQNLPTGALHINLKGTSVGNGLTNPEIQYAYYPEMARSTNGHPAAVSNATYAIMKAAVPPCIEAIKGCDRGIPETCVLATDICNLALIEPYSLTGLNPYDMREKCKVPPAHCFPCARHQISCHLMLLVVAKSFMRRQSSDPTF